MQATSTKQRAVLAFRPRSPLDAGLTLARYGHWGPDPASPYREGSLYRVARSAGGLVPFRLTVSGAPSGPRATVVFPGPDTPTVRRALRRETALLLGEAWELDAFYAAMAADPVLAPLVGRD